MTRPAKYYDLSVPTPVRLATIRAEFETHGKRFPRCPEYLVPKTWRDVRRYGFHDFANAHGTASMGLHNGAPCVYSFDAQSLPVRRIIDAHDVNKRLELGWYSDCDGQETVVGMVAYLSHGRYLSGFRQTDNDEFVILCGHVFDDENDCARDANETARIHAESMRDDDERFRAMSDAENDCESKQEELCEAWTEYRAAWFAYLQGGKRFAGQAIKAREWVQELIVDLRAFRVELSEKTAAYENGGK